eukprot:6693148-Prorocentrum_lima.AAC.1
MTSSLVGSEMCIRDRLWGWFARRCISSNPSFSASRRKARRATRRVRAVSYTHLTLPTICSV